MSRARQLFVPGLVLAIAAGAWLRFHGLAGECLWFDETAQLEWNNKPFLTFFRERWDQVDPPLNEIVAYIYNNILRSFHPGAPLSEWSVRLPTVVYGLLTIGIAGLAARCAFGPASGLAAAWLLAVNPYHIRYSQEARMYALTILLCAAAVWMLARHLAESAFASRWSAWWFGLFLGLAVYSHYYALLVLASAGVASLYCWIRTGFAHFKQLFFGTLLGGLISVPWILAQALHMRSSGQGTRPWLTGLGTPGVEALWVTARSYATDLTGPAADAAQLSRFAPVAVVLVCSALGLLLILGTVAFGSVGEEGGIRAGTPEARALRLHLVCMIVLPVLSVFLISQKRPLFHPRYLSCIFPALIMLASASRFQRLKLASCISVIIASPWLYITFFEHIKKPDYRSAVSVLQTEFKPGDAVDVSFIDQVPLLYYAKLAGGRPALVDAIEHTKGNRHRPPNPLSADYAPRPLDPGTRLFELDMLPPWSRLYSIEPANLYRSRMKPPAGPPTHELIFKSGPFSYLRIWRRNS